MWEGTTLLKNISIWVLLGLVALIASAIVAVTGYMLVAIYLAVVSVSLFAIAEREA